MVYSEIEDLERAEAEREQAIRERDEAREIARAIWRERYLGDEAPDWLTVDSPEDIARREARQRHDIAVVNALFAPTETPPTDR